MDNIIETYVNEYGDGLIKALTEPDIVEAEVVEDGEERDSTGEAGLYSEDEREDASNQEEE